MEIDPSSAITIGTQAATAITAAWVVWVRGRKRLHAIERSLTAAHGLVTSFGEAPAAALLKRLEALETRMEIVDMRGNILCDRLGVGIYICSLDARCSYANATLSNLFGVDREDMLGWGWLAGITPSDQLRVKTSWALAVQEKLPYKDTYRLRSGPTVQTEAFLLASKSGFLGYVVVLSNTPQTPVP